MCIYCKYCIFWGKSHRWLRTGLVGFTHQSVEFVFCYCFIEAFLTGHLPPSLPLFSLSVLLLTTAALY